MRGPLRRFGLVSAAAAPTLTRAATVPSCAVCAGWSVLGAPLASIGLMGTAIVLHELLVILAPLNLVLLWRTFRQHRQPQGLVVASVGVLFILMHLTSHVVPRGYPILWVLRALSMPLIWVGTTLLVAGALLDWRVQRRPVFNR